MGYLGFLLGLLYFVYNSTFSLYGSMFHFMLAWIVLFDPPLYMGIAILRVAHKYIGAYLSMAHKSAYKSLQYISWHGQDASRHGRGHKLSSPLSRSP